MSKFTEEFCEKYGNTKKLKRITNRLRERNCFNREMRQANMNLTRITSGKLGRTL